MLKLPLLFKSMQTRRRQIQSLSNSDATTNLREDILVEMLYITEFRSGTTTLFRLLRDYLTLKGLQCTQHPNNSAISWGILTMVYGLEQDKRESHEIISIARRYPDAPSPSQRNEKYRHFDDSKFAHSLFNLFKHPEKFIGKLSEHINEYISN